MNNVEHPDHYNKSRIECIDALNAMVQNWSDPITACMCWNAVKYIWRHPFKGNSKEDLEKAIYYLNKAIHRHKEIDNEAFIHMRDLTPEMIYGRNDVGNESINRL